MGIFDKLKSKAGGSQGNKAKQKVSDAAEKQANQRTGNKYESQVDDAQHKVEGQMGITRDRPDDQR